MTCNHKTCACDKKRKSPVLQIHLDDAYSALAVCAALITEVDTVAYLNMDKLTGNSENVFATFRFTDDAQGDCIVKFTEGKNQYVRTSGCLMTLVDTDGDDISVCLLGNFDIAGFVLSRHDASTCVQTVMEYMSMSSDQLRLMCGEMPAQEIRTVRAVLRAVLEKSKKKGPSNGNSNCT